MSLSPHRPTSITTPISPHLLPRLPSSSQHHHHYHHYPPPLSFPVLTPASIFPMRTQRRCRRPQPEHASPPPPPHPPHPPDPHTSTSPLLASTALAAPHPTIPRSPSSALQLPSSVRIVEVGPRDGLQNEPRLVDTAVKVSLVHDLVGAGLRTVEVTAFVSPKWVPQLADAAAVMRAVQPRPGVAYPVLVPNLHGLRAAVAAGATEVAVFASATEAFSMRNLNCSVEEALRRFEQVCREARKGGVKVRGYVSCVVGCPYEGVVQAGAVARVARRLYAMGCYEVSLGDTIGAGNPASVVRVVEAVVGSGVPVGCVAMHCHDTRGAALANVLAAMSVGVSVVDASVGGLGGCPFARGAPGNLATEDLVYMLEAMGVEVEGVCLDKVAEVGRRICKYLGRETGSKVARAGAARSGGSGLFPSS